MTLKKADHIRTFTILWLGQTISVFGSGLTSFALGVWVFERSGSATAFALIGLFAVLPRVLFSPLAGALIDRWDRRFLMIASDTLAGLGTLLIVLLLRTDALQLWQIYLLVGLIAAAGAIQWPAYTATTTLLVPKERLGRANGMQQIGQALSEILAPALAGVLLLRIGLDGVITIDFFTFLLALCSLLLLRFPLPEATPEHAGERNSLRADLFFGWNFIRARKGLAGLLGLLSAVNFLWGMVGALIVPLILGFSDSERLGLIISIAGAGMLTGSLVMSAWGGPKRRVNGVLGFEALSGLCFILIGLRPSWWLVAAGAFGAHITIALIFGANQAIWQRKTPSEAQGRVFAAQQMAMRAAAPLAYLLAGPLAERVFDPLLAPGGPLAGGLGVLIGSGPGRGIGLLFILMGALKIGFTLVGYLNPRIRYVEDELPDAIVS